MRFGPILGRFSACFRRFQRPLAQRAVGFPSAQRASAAGPLGGQRPAGTARARWGAGPAAQRSGRRWRLFLGPVGLIKMARI